MMDAEERSRKYDAQRTLREIARAEAADRKARKAERPARTPKVMDGEPGSPTPRKGISRQMRNAVLMDQGGRCGGCAGPLAFNVAYDVDHIIPLALGGEDCTGNWQVLCKSCHKAKTKRDVAAIAKAKRLAKRHFEGPTPSRRPIRGRASW